MIGDYEYYRSRRGIDPRLIAYGVGLIFVIWGVKRLIGIAL